MSAFDPKFIESISKDKGMSGTQKLLAIGMITVATLIGGTVGLQAIRSDLPDDRKIMVEYGYTQNMGNYESRKIRASYAKTLRPTDEVDIEMDKELYDLKRFVHDKLSAFSKD